MTGWGGRMKGLRPEGRTGPFCLAFCHWAVQCYNFGNPVGFIIGTIGTVREASQIFEVIY